MIIINKGHSFDYEMEKLARLFMPFERIVAADDIGSEKNYAVCSVYEQNGETYTSAHLVLGSKQSEHTEKASGITGNERKKCQLTLARQLFYCFRDITGYLPEWGILTGIRPAKLYSQLVCSLGEELAQKAFCADYLANANKISLCKEAHEGENKIISLSSPMSYSLYLSVPFCPSRCSYCSFVSHSIERAQDMIPQYVEYLLKELEITAKIAKQNNLKLETVYMGGGTPTTLSADELKTVLSAVRKNFDMSAVREFTVEAGRPDTITAEKLAVIKQCGATRISINPQTLNDDVLKAIGRNHTSQQTVDAFNLARSMGFDNINMDLIAGLPCDTVESFAKTLDGIIALDPESVTVHALSMKRASTLNAHGDFPELEAGRTAAIMVDTARKTLTERGVLPYYMYRQSKTVGNLENVGYAKKGFEGLYNVYIMDETHTILACGASAVTKLKAYDTGDISRIFNFKYPYEYIGRFEEQIQRKEGIGEFYDKHFGAYKQ